MKYISWMTNKGISYCLQSCTYNNVALMVKKICASLILTVIVQKSNNILLSLANCRMVNKECTLEIISTVQC